MHNLSVGKVELAHVQDLRGVVKTIVGKVGDKAQLIREEQLLMRYLGVLAMLGERNSMIKARALSPVGEIGE